MRYLKTFESIFDRFKVGDIITCNRAGDYRFLKNGDTYLVTSSDFDLIKVDNYDVDLNRTRFRLATPEEIEEYKLEKDSKNYNL